MSRGPGRPAGMYTQTARVLRMADALWSEERVGIPELARDLGVTERTVRRDVEALRAAGWRLVVEEAHVGLAAADVAAHPAIRAAVRYVRARARVVQADSDARNDETVVDHYREALDETAEELRDVAASLARGEIRLSPPLPTTPTTATITPEVSHA